MTEFNTEQIKTDWRTLIYVMVLVSGALQYLAVAHLMEQKENEIIAFFISLEIKGSSSYDKLCISFAVFAVSNKNYAEKTFWNIFSLLHIFLCWKKWGKLSDNKL